MCFFAHFTRIVFTDIDVITFFSNAGEANLKDTGEDSWHQTTTERNLVHISRGPFY